LAASSAYEAVHALLDPLQQAISCVANAKLVASGYDLARERQALALNRGLPVPLRGASRLSVKVIHHYRVVEIEPHRGWHAHTTGYLYTFQEQSSEREIIAYHWHPWPTLPAFPHLHLYAGAEVGYPYLPKSHLPTGRVTLQAVLRLALTELAVLPARGRERDWATILDATEASFNAADASS
jgi:hypothetical protein